MGGEKRGRPFDTSGSHNQFKKHKPNDFHNRNGSSSNGRGGVNNGPHGKTGANNKPLGSSGGSSNVYRDKTNPALERMEQLGDPKNCKPCKTATAEMRGGLIMLLDQLVQQEADKDDSKDITYHARELHRLLSKQASNDLPSKTKRELDSKQPEQASIIPIPPYISKRISLASDLPPLPPITDSYLQEAVFTHSSANNQNNAKGYNTLSINYERLEFLGDAYIEIIASRLIYSRFPHLETSQQSHFREQLVKNETLAKFSEGYGLEARLKHGSHMGNTKGWTKVVADVFEAYVAAVVLDDPKKGFETAETWLTELWAPQLLEYKVKPIENARARDEIAKLLGGKGIKLDYRMERDMIMVDGVQKYFIGLYLTGWGYDDEWLGSGEGQNKAQACVFAAGDALSNRKELVGKANKKKLEMYPPKPKEGEGYEKPSGKEDGKMERRDGQVHEDGGVHEKADHEEKKRKKKEKREKKRETDSS